MPFVQVDMNDTGDTKNDDDTAQLGVRAAGDLEIDLGCLRYGGRYSQQLALNERS
jgi:hypothetical protein